MMNQIYKDVITKHALKGTIIRIYMDDIAIATSTSLPDHIAAVKDVLTVAQITRPVLQTGEVHFPCPVYRLPGGNP